MALEVRNPKHISIYSNIKSGKINYYVYQKKKINNISLHSLTIAV